MKRFLVGLIIGIVFAYAVITVGTPPPANSWADLLYSDHLMSGEPPLPIPPLSEIIGDAATDAAAQAAIRDYYNRQSLRLAAVFRSDNDERTRALFGMYIVHLAAPYNEVARAWVGESLLAFVNGATAHCGAYAQAQQAVYDALGLRWRSVGVDGGWHELVEAEISGKFEVFDATSNVWVSEPIEALLDGIARDYRAFYTPIFDVTAPDVYRAHLEAGYSVPELRAGLPLWGLYVHPRTVEIVAQSP